MAIVQPGRLIHISWLPSQSKKFSVVFTSKYSLVQFKLSFVLGEDRMRSEYVRPNDIKDRAGIKSKEKMMW